ncbi:uncharacterized protein LOC131857266 [Cryptomeria japonica]|uniref:uncharacterized protein LOC131857266 n=1 Tax=Cryptomeria japonica TaxID=3369 RepID=UPI0027DA7CFC|nr:uncharacterized protein LOC131857266 [Cryptomeria japonica]
MEGSTSKSESFPINNLLGCKQSQGEVSSFVTHIANTTSTSQGRGINPTPEIKAYPALHKRAACEYHNYKPLGMSFCFEDSILQAIHVYNGIHGFSVCKAELPLGIRLNMDGQEIVTILGEPDDKMGGAHGGPISLAYKDKGLQINFIGSDWEDRHNRIDNITIHQPLE